MVNIGTLVDQELGDVYMTIVSSVYEGREATIIRILNIGVRLKKPKQHTVDVGECACVCVCAFCVRGYVYLKQQRHGLSIALVSSYSQSSFTSLMQRIKHSEIQAKDSVCAVFECVCYVVW